MDWETMENVNVMDRLFQDEYATLKKIVKKSQRGIAFLQKISLDRVCRRYRNFMDLCHASSESYRRHLPWVSATSCSYFINLNDRQLKELQIGSSTSLVVDPHLPINVYMDAFPKRDKDKFIHYVNGYKSEFSDMPEVTFLFKPCFEVVIDRLGEPHFYLYKQQDMRVWQLELRAKSNQALDSRYLCNDHIVRYIDDQLFADLSSHIFVAQKDLPLFLGSDKDDLFVESKQANSSVAIPSVTDKCTQLQALQKEWLLLEQSYQTLLTKYIALHVANEKVVVPEAFLFQWDAQKKTRVLSPFYRDNQILRFVKLSFIDFTGVSLVDDSQEKPKGIDFSMTDVSIDPQTVYGKDLRGCNFTGCNFTFKDFTGVRLDGANLTGTQAIIWSDRVISMDDCILDHTCYCHSYEKKPLSRK